jgi:hypothetical protein
MYAIEIEPDIKLIIVRLSGLMTVDEVERLREEEQSALVALGYRSGDYLLLVDTSGCVIQSQDVIAAFQAAIAAARLSASRVAVVRGPSLTLLQSQRILRSRENALIAADEAEARSWLMQADATHPGRAGTANPICTAGRASPRSSHAATFPNASNSTISRAS